MTTTVRDILNESLSDLGVKAMGQTLSDAILQSALEKLNRMIDSWANENLMIYGITEENFPLVSGQAEYSIGADGSPDFDTVRPQEIMEKGNFVRDDNGTTDYRVKLVSLQQYREISLKSTSGRPHQMAYNPTYPNGTLYFYFTPESGRNIYLRSLKEIGEFAGLGATVDLPPGYKRALITNGAVEIAPSHGRTISPALALQAAQSKTSIKRRNTGRLEPTQMEVGQLTRRRTGTILTGWLN